MPSRIASGGRNYKDCRFWKFCSESKRERKGRNPKTGEEIGIKPRKVVTFSQPYIKQYISGDRMKEPIIVKLFYKISEVSKAYSLESYVLRYWETELLH